jgi:hypothetical protein
VGDFYKRALQGRAIDESARFPNPPEQSWFGGFFDRFGKQLRQWGGDEREEPAPIEDRTPRRAPPSEENYEQQIRREAAKELEAQKEIERELQRMGR